MFPSWNFTSKSCKKKKKKFNFQVLRSWFHGSLPLVRGFHLWRYLEHSTKKKTPTFVTLVACLTAKKKCTESWLIGLVFKWQLRLSSPETGFARLSNHDGEWARNSRRHAATGCRTFGSVPASRLVNMSLFRLLGVSVAPSGPHMSLLKHWCRTFTR